MLARADRVSAAYAACSLALFAGAWALGRNPLVYADAWLGTTGAAAVFVSAGLGALVAAATVAATRVLLVRTAWARALADDLRPLVRGAGDGALLFAAAASGIGEELLFRGLLVPAIGVVASSIAFGVVHQVRGRARWAWIAWATVTGLALGLVFVVTGSLVGPMIAHVSINAANLRLLRDVGADPGVRRPRRMGGLLAR